MAVRIGHLNIRSLRANLDLFLSTLHTYHLQYDIIFLTEIWITSDVIHLYQIPGFLSNFVCRTFNRSGGVAVYYRSQFNISTTQLDCLGAEVMCLDLNDLNTKIIAVYRDISSSPIDFVNDLMTLIDDMNSKINIVLAGDFNINILHDDHVTDCYLNELLYRGFVSLINTVTRPHVLNSGTCLDHVFVRAKDIHNYETNVISLDITDHYLLEVKLSNVDNNVCSEDNVSDTDYASINYKLLMNLLKYHSWKNVYGCSDVNRAYDLFNSEYLELIKKSTYVKVVTNKRGNSCGWMHDNIKNWIRKRNNLYKLTRRFPADVDLYQKYRKIRNYCTSIIRNSKYEYYCKEFYKNKSSTAKQWNIINELIGRKRKKMFCRI